MDNDPQLVSKICSALCASLGAKLVTAKKFYTQFNVQIERYNKTLVALLRHYIDEH